MRRLLLQAEKQWPTSKRSRQRADNDPPTPPRAIFQTSYQQYLHSTARFLSRTGPLIDLHFVSASRRLVDFHRLWLLSFYFLVLSGVHC